MGKRSLRNINFRQTHSERSATKSYQNFGHYIKKGFYKIINKKNYAKS